MLNGGSICSSGNLQHSTYLCSDQLLSLQWLQLEMHHHVKAILSAADRCSLSSSILQHIQHLPYQCIYLGYHSCWAHCLDTCSYHIYLSQRNPCGMWENGHINIVPTAYSAGSCPRPTACWLPSPSVRHGRIQIGLCQRRYDHTVQGLVRAAYPAPHILTSLSPRCRQALRCCNSTLNGGLLDVITHVLAQQQCANTSTFGFLHRPVLRIYCYAPFVQVHM